MKPLRYAIVTALYEPQTVNETMAFVTTITAYLETRAQVEILTTCASAAGENAHAPGHDLDGALHVHRFSQQRLALRLEDYVETFANRYDGFIFVGSPDEIVRLGIERVSARSLAVPFDIPSHDVSHAFASVAIVYPSEMVRNAFVALDPALVGPLIWPEVVVPSTIDPKRFRSTHEIFSPFYLVVGGSPDADSWRELLENFTKYRAETASNRKLVLTSKLPAAVSTDIDGVVALDDRLGEAEFWDSLAAAEAAIFISDEQSADGCLKAWALRKPVLVDVRAPNAVEECRRSGGGLWYEDAGQFAIALELLDERDLAPLGAQGSLYVSQYNLDRKTGPVIASVLRRFSFDAG